MAMSLATDDDGDVVSSINTTPLVDVMLVLLIIFLITVPVVTRSIAVALPKEVNVPRASRPDTITLAVDRQGQVWWDDQRVPTTDALVTRLADAARRQPPPDVQLRGDADVAYEHVGRVMHAAQRAGLRKVGFITQPPARGG